jgi:hypothetical protein
MQSSSHGLPVCALLCGRYRGGALLDSIALSRAQRRGLKVTKRTQVESAHLDGHLRKRYVVFLFGQAFCGCAHHGVRVLVHHNVVLRPIDWPQCLPGRQGPKPNHVVIQNPCQYTTQRTSH